MRMDVEVTPPREKRCRVVSRYLGSPWSKGVMVQIRCIIKNVTKRVLTPISEIITP